MSPLPTLQRALRDGFMKPRCHRVIVLNSATAPSKGKVSPWHLQMSGIILTLLLQFIKTQVQAILWQLFLQKLVL